MKRRYKVLLLPRYFCCSRQHWEHLIRDDNKIDPIFNRPGWYLDRQTRISWIEIDGKAYKHLSKEAFLYDLMVDPDYNNMMDVEIYNALEVMIRYRLATKNQKARFDIERDKRILLKNGRDAALRGFQSRKRLLAFKEKLANKSHGLK